jgi:translation initiation factor IF-2
MEQEPQQGSNQGANQQSGKNEPGNPPKIRLNPATTGGAIPKPKIKLQSPGTTGSSVIPPPSGAQKPAVAPAETPKPAPTKRSPDTVSVPPLTAPAPAAHKNPIIEQAAVPKTIKIKRPGTSALKPPTIDTKDKKKQTSRVDIHEALATNAPADATPRTIKLKRPGTTIIEKAEPTPDSTTQFKIDNARKSETSRIELPAEATVEMPKRRKTVQIKRSGAGGGGGGGGATTVRRPGTRLVMNTASSPAISAKEDREPDIIITSDESTVVFSLVSLVATLVALVVLYVLAAQTIMPSLPWVGKL